MPVSRDAMVKILLSVHNGEKYLDELLDSIEAQQYQRWSLVVADDGSTDRSAQILDRRLAGHDRMSLAVRRDEPVGPAASFLDLLHHVDDGELFAFCDQDDVWFVQKLAWTVDAVVGLASEHGGSSARQLVAVSTDAIVTDSRLRPVDASALSGHGVRGEVTLGRLFVNNVAIGATLVGTSDLAVEARELAVGQEIRMHDWWCALIAAYAGTFAIIPAPTMWWRRHERTVTGGQPRTPSGRVNRRLESLAWSRVAAALLLRELAPTSEAARDAATALASTRPGAPRVRDLLRLRRHGVRPWSVKHSVNLVGASLLSRRTSGL